MCLSVVWPGEGHSAGLSGSLLLQLLRCVCGQMQRMTSANTLPPALLRIVRVRPVSRYWTRQLTQKDHGRRFWAVQQEFMNTNKHTRRCFTTGETITFKHSVWLVPRVRCLVSCVKSVGQIQRLPEHIDMVLVYIFIYIYISVYYKSVFELIYI